MALHKIANYLLRAVPGAYILNSGLSKLGASDEAAAGMQGLAASGIPQLSTLDSQQFAKLLAGGEIALGGALLLPFIPNRLVGLALGAFSGGLMSIYFRNEAMTEDGIRPSAEGTAMAKDSWLAAIALVLITAGGKKKAKKLKKAA